MLDGSDLSQTRSVETLRPRTFAASNLLFYVDFIPELPGDIRFLRACVYAALLTKGAAQQVLHGRPSAYFGGRQVEHGTTYRSAPDGAGFGCGRRGLRRYRHQPALHDQRDLRPLWRRGLSVECAWRFEPGLLVTGNRGIDQVPAVHHGSRQQGRGRHHGVDGAGPTKRAPASAPGTTRCDLGNFWRRPFLWRWRHHPGHLDR